MTALAFTPDGRKIYYVMVQSVDGTLTYCDYVAGANMDEAVDRQRERFAALYGPGILTGVTARRAMRDRSTY